MAAAARTYAMTTTTPAIDLEWAVDEDMPPGPYPRESRWVFRRVPEVVTEAATRGRPARVLDIACGLGGQMALLRERGCETWGLDASMALVRHCQRQFARAGGAPLVCGVAESLPFRSNSFDRVVCQGSLDHFARPRAFMAELARILKPDGRAVIALANFESLSCRLGRGLYRAKELLGIPVMGGRAYWQIPPNHTFKGDYAVLRAMASPWLRLERCQGVSMLWLFRRWSLFVEALPEDVAWALLRTVDRIARRMPGLSDMMVSVWRPTKAGGTR